MNQLVEVLDSAEHGNRGGTGIDRQMAAPEAWARRARVAGVHEPDHPDSPAGLLFQLLKHSAGVSSGADQQDPARPLPAGSV
jgi:hypothetical protein